MNNLPYTKQKPLTVLKYKTDYENAQEHGVKIYNDHIVMSRKGFEELLFSNREYQFLNEIYRTAGKLNEDGSSTIMSLYPN